MLNKEERLKIEVNLILMLMELCPECLLYMGIQEKYVIADRAFTGQFALGRIVDCNDIYEIIKESGKGKLFPKEVFRKMVDKGWLDDIE